MKKIPTLFERDWSGDRSRVLPGLPLINIGGAMPTRKWDGTCCLVRDGRLYKRRAQFLEDPPPENFEPAETDEQAGNVYGWVPVGDGPDDRWHRQAFSGSYRLANGTFELVGPKINGNPQGFEEHVLLPHGQPLLDAPLSLATFDEIRTYLEHATRMEGIVWLRNGEPIAKIKRRDFGLPWPVTK